MNNYVGKEFGRLTIIQFQKGKKHSRFLCKCSCGEEKSIRTDHVISGATRSCGCYWQERRIESNTRHGLTGTRVYRIWHDMRTRCHYEKYPEWHLYGGRGISVCERWRYSFENFFADMGMPAPHLSIDRIDVNGNYEPGNCRWATAKEQAQNKRKKVVLEQQ